MSEVSVWGDFEVHFDRVLGRGGMGTVYEARQRSLDRRVAVKVLDTSLARDPVLAQGFLERFQIEAKALARLRDPRIVTVLQAGQDGGRCWFAMELIDGVTVEDRLAERGAFPEADARRVALETARALDAALREGITHRDVKPANIFLCADGSVKLADFGLARSEEFSRTRLTDADAVACTPSYTAPEQVDGRPTDHRSDLYSLGCVLFEMLTERPPFVGRSPMETLFKHASEEVLSPRVLNPEVSEEFEAVLLKCLSKDPDKRYDSYSELIAALERPRDSEKREWFWPSSAAAGATLLGVILTAVFVNVEPPGNAAEPIGPLPAPARIADRAPAAPQKPPAPAMKPEPLFRRLRGYTASPREIQFLGRLVDLFSAHRDRLLARAYDRPLQELSALEREEGEYATAHFEAARGLLLEARGLVQARLKRVRTSKGPLLLRLAGGTATGEVVKAEETTLTLRGRDGKEVSIELGRLAAEEFLSDGIPPNASLAFRGLSVDPGLALTQALGDSVLAVPVLVRLARLDAVAAVDRTLAEKDFASSRVTFQKLGAFLESAREVTALYGHLAQEFEIARREGEALRTLAGGRPARVLLAFEGTRAHPVAAELLLSRFEAELAAASEELMAGTGSVDFDWRLHPPEPVDAVRRRYVKRVSEDDVIVLSDPEGPRHFVMNDPLPAGAAGLWVRFAAESKEWRLALAGLYLRLDGREVGLYRPSLAPEGSDQVLASGPLPPSGPGLRTLALVPGEGALHVYVDGCLVLSARDAALPARLAFTVKGATLSLRNVKTKVSK